MRTLGEREFLGMSFRDQLWAVREAAVAVQQGLVVEVSRGPMLEKVAAELGLERVTEELIKALDAVRKSGLHTLPGDRSSTSGVPWHMWQPFKPGQTALEPGQKRANGSYDPATGEVLGPLYGPACTAWSKSAYLRAHTMRQHIADLEKRLHFLERYIATT